MEDFPVPIVSLSLLHHFVLNGSKERGRRKAKKPPDLCQIAAQEKPAFYFLNKGTALFVSWLVLAQTTARGQSHIISVTVCGH